LPVDDRPLIELMFTCFDALRRNGWREVVYAPYDKTIELIEPGSTGIHRGFRDYDEDRFWIVDSQDTYPSRPILFRLIPN